VELGAGDFEFSAAGEAGGGLTAELVIEDASQVSDDGERVIEFDAIDLSPKEFALLEFLMRHAGHPVSRSTIVEQLWRVNVNTVTNVVDVYTNYLRRQVDTAYDRPLIRTVRGTDYQIGTNGFVS
jgi:DNA-binding response OmpR family regulator